jgi:hypothetical protein
MVISRGKVKNVKKKGKTNNNKKTVPKKYTGRDSVLISGKLNRH